MIFYITSPQGEDTGKTAKTVQKANSHYSGLNPNTPPLDKKYKASLVWEHRDLSDTALYHGILPPSYNSAHAHTHTADRTGSGSFSPLTFSKPLGPCHDAQTTHCTERYISTRVHVNSQQHPLHDVLVSSRRAISHRLIPSNPSTQPRDIFHSLESSTPPWNCGVFLFISFLRAFPCWLKFLLSRWYFNFYLVCYVFFSVWSYAPRILLCCVLFYWQSTVEQFALHWPCWHFTHCHQNHEYQATVRNV